MQDAISYSCKIIYLSPSSSGCCRWIQPGCRWRNITACPCFHEYRLGYLKNAQQSKYSDSYRIIQVFDDAQRRKGSQLGGNQHLRSVRDDTLDDTRESIQDTCTLAFVHPVTGSDVVGQWSHCDDGYRIVGCTEIGDAHQSCDAKFGAAFAVDVFGQFWII